MDSGKKRQKKRHIVRWRFHENGQFEKMGNLARILQRFGKNSNEVTKRGILPNGSYMKMENLDKNAKFRRKWRLSKVFFKGLAKYSVRCQKGASWQLIVGFTKWQIWQEFTKGLAKIKPIWKSKHVDNCESYGNDKLRNWPVWQRFIEGLTKKIVRQQKKHIDSWQFPRTWLIWEKDKWGI